MSNSIQRVQMFSCKYLQVTNYKSARIKITDEYYNESIIISYHYKDNNFNDMWQVAKMYLEDLGYNISTYCRGKNLDFLGSSEYKTSSKEVPCMPLKDAIKENKYFK
jgi:hypothetical protein